MGRFSGWAPSPTHPCPDLKWQMPMLRVQSHRGHMYYISLKKTGQQSLSFISHWLWFPKPLPQMPEYNPLHELSFPCSTSPTTLGSRKTITAFWSSWWQKMFQRGHCHLPPLVTSLLSGPQDAFSRAPSPHHAGNSGLLPARAGSGNDSLCSLCFRHQAHHAPAWWKRKYQKSNKKTAPPVSRAALWMYLHVIWPKPELRCLSCCGG